MDREKLLAAELFAYSYQNYEDHLGIGNPRFEEMMPVEARTIERAYRENWSMQDLARELGLDAEHVKGLLDSYSNAIEIVDAQTPAKALRNALRQSFDTVLGDRRVPDHEIEEFLNQACYRVSDFLFLMESQGSGLREMSDELRRDS